MKIKATIADILSALGAYFLLEKIIIMCISGRKWIRESGTQ